ncbi:TPA: hypothetical protein ACGZ96_003598 [Elizabethkingia anophelis]
MWVKYLTVLFFIFSCRAIDNDGDIVNDGKSIAVQVNLMGSDYLNNSDDGIYQNKVSMLNHSEYMKVTLSPYNKKINNQDYKINNYVSSINTGVKFRVIVYNNKNDYKVHKDYTVGETITPILLEKKLKYTIISYSYNSSFLPEIGSDEMKNLSKALIYYNDKNRDLMFNKQVFYISDNTNTLNIILRHQISEIVFNFRGENISFLRNATVSPHYNSGIFNFNEGILNVNPLADNSLSIPLVFPLNNNENTRFESETIYINPGSTGNIIDLSLSGNVLMNDFVKPFRLNNIKIISGYKAYLNIDLSGKCGAYIGPNNTNWRNFMCHNLGADYNSDPFEPSSKIHGAKFQWGYKPINYNISDNKYYTQLDDQGNSGLISGWSYLNTIENDWNEGTEYNPIKSSNDPCPKGYRVPTISEFKDVAANNNYVKIGNWYNSSTNYDSGYFFGTGLFMPAAGYRDIFGSLAGRGYYGDYLTTSKVGSISAYSFSFYKEYVGSRNSNPSLGMSIRCISEN